MYVSDGRKEEIQNLLGVPKIKEYEKYLGLPAIVGEIRKQAWTTLRSEFGINCRVERKSYYPKQVEKFY